MIEKSLLVGGNWQRINWRENRMGEKASFTTVLSRKAFQSKQKALRQMGYNRERNVSLQWAQAQQKLVTTDINLTKEWMHWVCIKTFQSQTCTNIVFFKQHAYEKQSKYLSSGPSIIIHTYFYTSSFAVLHSRKVKSCYKYCKVSLCSTLPGFYLLKSIGFVLRKTWDLQTILYINVQI